MLLGDFPLTQWAAVSTQWGAIKEPPQNWDPDDERSMACQGQLFFIAAVPPTMRTLGLDPQLPTNYHEPISLSALLALLAMLLSVQFQQTG